VSVFERADHENEHSSSIHNHNLATPKAFFADEDRISPRAEPGTIIAGVSNMDVPRKSMRRLQYIRHGLHALAGFWVIILITVGVSHMKLGAARLDRRAILVGTIERGSMLRQARGAGTFVSDDILRIPMEIK